MRNKRLIVLALAPALLGLSACSDLLFPDRTDEALALKEVVLAGPHVASAHLDYTPSAPLDSDRVLLGVRMDATATPADIGETINTAYETIAESYHSWEIDIDVVAGRNRLHLRTYEPEAEPDAVAAHVAAVVDAMRHGSASSAVNTQEVARGDHVTSTTRWRLPVGTKKPELLSALEELRAAQGDDTMRDWDVVAADGTGLGSDRGVPGAGLLALQERLAAVSDVVTVHLDQRTHYKQKPWYDVRTSVPSAMGPAEIADIVQRQTAILNGDDAWSDAVVVVQRATGLRVNGCRVKSDDPSYTKAVKHAVREAITC